MIHRTIIQLVIPFFLVSLLPGKEKAPEKEAKQLHPEQPMLWVVEGKKLTKPAYLFGTLHRKDPEIVALHPLVEKAFKEAEVFHNETKGDAKAGLAVALHMVRRDGKSLDESLGKARAKKFHDIVNELKPGSSTKALQRYKTWAAAVGVLGLVTPDKKKAKKAPLKGLTLDRTLATRAQDNEIEILPLGTQKSELSFFDALTEEEQIAMLFSFLENAQTSAKKEEEADDSQLELYRSGDAEGFAQRNRFDPTDFITEEGRAFGKRFHNYMVTERSKTMAEAILKHLKTNPDKTRFVAVGVGHFVGDDSINKILEKEGFTVSRVRAKVAAPSR